MPSWPRDWNGNGRQISSRCCIASHCHEDVSFVVMTTAFPPQMNRSVLMERTLTVSTCVVGGFMDVALN